MLTILLGIISSALGQRCRCGIGRSWRGNSGRRPSHKVQEGRSCCNDVLSRPCNGSFDCHRRSKRPRIVERWRVQAVCYFARGRTCSGSGKSDVAGSCITYLCGSDCLECSFRGQDDSGWRHCLDTRDRRSEPFCSRSKL